ncbi:MAG TPA: hypothetical protein VEN81_11205 [Planctomycetota bacterium]|nr:hypothetical protein [Planctomycetota bacterium]
MMALLAAVLLGAQEPPEIAGWIRDLGDDAIEVRERATVELVRVGRRAEPALREAVRRGGEAGGRAAQVLAEIAKAERTRLFEAAPSRITLRKKDASLRETLEDIQKQTGCKLTTSFAPEGEKITIAFENTPLFEAVDALCRACRRTTYSVENRREDVSVSIAEGKCPDWPRVFRDQYFVRLEGLSLSTVYDLQGGGASKCRLDFRWGWEKGTRPQQAVLRIEELVDDLGNSYVADLPDPAMRPVGFAYVTTQQPVEWTRVPPAGATRFAKIRGSLDLSFPETLLVFPFEKPEESAGTLRKTEGGSVRLVSCARDRTRLRAKIGVHPGELVGRLEMKALDPQGREYPGRYTRGEAGDGESVLLSVEFTLPESSEAASLQFSSPSGARPRRIPFEFKDVRIR